MTVTMPEEENEINSPYWGCFKLQESKGLNESAIKQTKMMQKALAEMLPESI